MTACNFLFKSVHLVLCFQLSPGIRTPLPSSIWWLQFSVKICTSCIELPDAAWCQNISTQLHLMTDCSFLLRFVHLVWYCASSYCQALEHRYQAPFDDCLKLSVKICTSCVGLPDTTWCQNTSTQLHLMTDWNFLLKSLHLVLYWTSSYCLAWEHLYTAPFGDWLKFSVKICTSCIVLNFQLPPGARTPLPSSVWGLPQGHHPFPAQCCQAGRWPKQNSHCR